MSPALPPQLTLHYFPDADSAIEHLSTLLTDRTSHRSSEAPLSVALSGGSTAQLLFAHWREQWESLPHQHLDFWWVDERMVPASDTESNYGNACRLLFDVVECDPQRLHPIVYQSDPQHSADAYNAALAADMSACGRTAPFDLALLGMGDDGHTSSLFPGQEFSHPAPYYITSVHPTNGVERVALSYDGIAQCREVVFVVLGESKNARLHEVLAAVASGDEARIAKLPAARAIHSAQRVRLLTDIHL